MSERRYDWLAALACIVPLLGFWTYGLFDLDEGFYAAVTGEMLRSGNWITPTYGGEPWFEKPILIYWAASATTAVFGELFGPRLPSILATLACCWLVFRFVASEFGRSEGRIAAIVYGTSLLPVAIGRMMMTDALLALGLFGSLALLWKGKGLYSGAALGVALLAKGPVAALLYGGIVLFSVIFLRERRAELTRTALLSVPMALAVPAVWYVPAWLANPEGFVQGFLIEQNWQRFLGGDTAHTLPDQIPAWSHYFFYPVLLLVAVLPWTPFVLPVLWRGPKQSEVNAFLVIAVLVPIAFFAFGEAKLPHYALPAVAPLACLAGPALAARFDSRRVIWFGAAYAVVLFAVMQSVLGSYYTATGQREAHAHARELRELDGNVLMHNLSGDDDESSLDPSLTPTSLPSMLFYLRGQGRRLVPIDEAIEEHGVRWILTRPNALRTEELGGHEVELQDATGQYWIYKVSR